MHPPVGFLLASTTGCQETRAASRCGPGSGTTTGTNEDWIGKQDINGVGRALLTVKVVVEEIGLTLTIHNPRKGLWMALW